MSDITTTRIFVDGEKGITAAKLNDIIASSSIQPAFYTGKPTASTADPSDTMLILKAGAYTQVPVSTLADSISTSEIWSARLRSFNAIGNPTFEVDQRNVGGGVAVTTTAWGVDRWGVQLSGTGRAAAQQLAENVAVPGTNYFITSKIFRTYVTTAEASLAAGDYLVINSNIEGPQLRELLGDVHSVSLLVRSSVANLKFGMTLQDSVGAYSLTKLCTLGSADTWTLITLANLPLWTASGTFPVNSGGIGYTFNIVLACGTTYTVASNDIWQSTAGFGAVGQDNFLATNGSYFDIAFVQHEPGPVCSTLMDKPFSQNYDECLRYYFKTYSYAVALGSVTYAGANGGFYSSVAGAANGHGVYAKRMAKIPTITLYSPASGTKNAVTRGSDAVNVAASPVVSMVGDSAFMQISSSAAAIPLGSNILSHYSADTGW